MKNQKLKLGIILFILGFTGVLTLLTIELPLENLPKEVTAQCSESTIKILTLINPTFLLIIAIVFGVSLHDKVKLDVPIINRFISGRTPEKSISDAVKSGMVGGVIAGILLLVIGILFYARLPQEFITIGENLKLTPAARLLYGGITEEILLRFGLMTVVVWIISKISKKLNPAVFWSGLIVAAVIFAIAHFPVAFQAVGSPSIGLLTYILLGNSIGGFIFGWLYWKKGLESAFIAHMFAHVVMMIGEPLLNLQ